MMRVLLGILGGVVTGWVATGAAVLAYGAMAGVSQAEGAFAMAAVFLIGPLGGALGAVAGGILGARWARRARMR